VSDTRCTGLLIIRSLPHVMPHMRIAPEPIGYSFNREEHSKHIMIASRPVLWHSSVPLSSPASSAVRHCSSACLPRHLLEVQVLRFAQDDNTMTP
jgi:hypothetical protein